MEIYTGTEALRREIRKLFYLAKEEIIIVTPYLNPDDELIEILREKVTGNSVDDSNFHYSCNEKNCEITDNECYSNSEESDNKKIDNNHITNTNVDENQRKCDSSDNKNDVETNISCITKYNDKTKIKIDLYLRTRDFDSSKIKNIYGLFTNIYNFPNLHTKIYINEMYAIFSSANLNMYSLTNNHEMGILLTREGDLDAYMKLRREVEFFTKILPVSNRPYKVNHIDSEELFDSKKLNFENMKHGQYIPPSILNDMINATRDEYANTEVITDGNKSGRYVSNVNQESQNRQTEISITKHFGIYKLKTQEINLLVFRTDVKHKYVNNEIHNKIKKNKYINNRVWNDEKLAAFCDDSFFIDFIDNENSYLQYKHESDQQSENKKGKSCSQAIKNILGESIITYPIIYECDGSKSENTIYEIKPNQKTKIIIDNTLWCNSLYCKLPNKKDGLARDSNWIWLFYPQKPEGIDNPTTTTDE